VLWDGQELSESFLNEVNILLVVLYTACDDEALPRVILSIISYWSILASMLSRLYLRHTEVLYPYAALMGGLLVVGEKVVMVQIVERS
jgi:hypothetical protein